MKYYINFNDLNDKMNKNNKFFGNIPKVDFNISGVTYLEDMRDDDFIQEKIRLLPWTDPKENLDGDLIGNFSTFSFSKANNHPIPIFITINTNNINEE